MKKEYELKLQADFPFMRNECPIVPYMFEKTDDDDEFGRIGSWLKSRREAEQSGEVDFRKYNSYELYGCACGDGWYELLHNLCSDITEAYNERGLEIDVVPVQIKEKFGTLRFYYKLSNSGEAPITLDCLVSGASMTFEAGKSEIGSVVSEIVHKWQKKSAHICERCGEAGEHRRNLPRIQTLCDACYEPMIEKCRQKLKASKIMEYTKIIEPDNGWGDSDMSSIAQMHYRETFPNYINFERGETWITPIALLEKLGNAKTIQALYPEFDNKKEKVKAFKRRLISKVSEIVLKEYTTNFSRCAGEDYHTLVNFGCIPAGLNTWRGSKNRYRLGDFPDLFFECVRLWFLKTDPEENDFGYSIVEKNMLDQYELWFKNFGEGEEGWKSFVDNMLLKGSFVDENYCIEYLFDHKIGKPFPNLSDITKAGNTYSFCELAETLSHQIEIRTSIKKIYDIWERRVNILNAERFMEGSL